MMSIPSKISRYRSLVNCQHHQHYVVKARKNVTPHNYRRIFRSQKKTYQIERSSDKPKKNGFFHVFIPKIPKSSTPFLFKNPPTPLRLQKKLEGNKTTPAPLDASSHGSTKTNPVGVVLRSNPSQQTWWQKGVSHVYLRWILFLKDQGVWKKNMVDSLTSNENRISI